MMKATVVCDGRGNAGTGARAAVLYIHDIAELPYDSSLNDTEIHEKAEKIPATTNIVAEHLSMQLGIELALEHGVTDLLILNDSQVPVYHLQGKYDVKQAHLKPVVEKTLELASNPQFEKIVVEWTPRENTMRADKLCRAVDKPPSRRSRPGGPLKEPEPRRNPFAKR